MQEVGALHGLVLGEAFIREVSVRERHLATH